MVLAPRTVARARLTFNPSAHNNATAGIAVFLATEISTLTASGCSRNVSKKSAAHRKCVLESAHFHISHTFLFQILKKRGWIVKLLNESRQISFAYDCAVD